MSAAIKPLPPGVEPLGVGLHDNVPAERYHADPCAAPSLSSGVVRVLVEQTPAHAYLEHIRLGGQKKIPTADMILGSFVHGLRANDLSEFEVGLYDNYQTKAAQGWRDITFASGKTPILEKTVDRAHKIAQALRDKAAVGITNSPFEMGKSEVTAIWQEEGFWFRARYDRLILDESAFGDVWDWKTTGNGVSPHALERIIIDKGYHIQAAHYLRGLRTLAPQFRGRLSFNLAFVETEPPYAVKRVPICEGFLSLGNRLLQQGIDRWKHCLGTNQWPDESEHPLILTPPTWYVKQIEEAA